MPIGLYGKYPGRRDFVAVNLPRHILQPLEIWLQGGLAASRERLAGDWLSRYMVQPFWNFKIGWGIWGVDCLGSMAPSVDGVGRQFPLVIIAYSDTQGSFYPSFEDLDLSAWFKEIQDRLLLAINADRQMEPADLIAGLPEPAAGTAKIVETAQDDWIGGQVICASADLDAARASVLDHHLSRSDKISSIWWTAGSALVSPQITTFQGLPSAWFMAEMMASARKPEGPDHQMTSEF